MTIGKRVPNTNWPIRVRDESIGGDNPFRWDELLSSDIFKDRRVLVFSLPGAFTPTCSTMQVPGFVENADLIKSMGIDDIYVVSVNDTFTMRKWMVEQNALDAIKFIPDGNGDFTEGMGMLVEKCNLGFGKRSWRYAMVVDDFVVEKFFEEPGIEDNCDSDPYGETSPQAVIDYLKSL